VIADSATASTPPLSRLLEQTADAVLAVQRGRSLTDVLALCPSQLRPGVQALSFHVLRRLGAAEGARAIIAARRPPPAVESLLLTGIALLWPDGAEPYEAHVLVDQAVNAAHRRAPRASAFVNAALRRFAREREALAATVGATPVGAWNHRAWWIDALQRDWPDAWQALLTADQLAAPMTLRVNRRRTDPRSCLERLAGAGMTGRLAGDAAIVLDRAVPVDRLPAFGAGEVSVQDASAQLAAPLLLHGLAEDAPLSSLAGARVLDACAAPGGKTAHLLELADVDVLALDVDASRLARVDETLRRLGLAARTLAADARHPQAWWDGRPFDAILLDAPCSASGIVRRHPDIRWLRRPEDLPALAAVQARLLEALWPLLRPGGCLLYATCSIFRREGQHQIDAFLQRHGSSGAALEARSPGHLLPLPDNGLTVAGTSGSRSAPGGGDGFFHALLRKGIDRLGPAGDSRA